MDHCFSTSHGDNSVFQSQQRFLEGAVESLLPIEANPVKEKRMKKKLRAANEKRLDNKKKHAMKKKERRRKDW